LHFTTFCCSFKNEIPVALRPSTPQDIVTITDDEDNLQHNLEQVKLLHQQVHTPVATFGQMQSQKQPHTKAATERQPPSGVVKPQAAYPSYPIMQQQAHALIELHSNQWSPKETLLLLQQQQQHKLRQQQLFQLQRTVQNQVETHQLQMQQHFQALQPANRSYQHQQTQRSVNGIAPHARQSVGSESNVRGPQNLQVKDNQIIFTSADVGRRVVVAGQTCNGTLMFVGPHHEHGRLRCGVAMDQTVQYGRRGHFFGHQYFRCASNTGLLVLPNKISFERTPEATIVRAASPSQSQIQSQQKDFQHLGDDYRGVINHGHGNRSPPAPTKSAESANDYLEYQFSIEGGVAGPTTMRTNITGFETEATRKRSTLELSALRAVMKSTASGMPRQDSSVPDDIPFKTDSDSETSELGDRPVMKQQAMPVPAAIVPVCTMGMARESALEMEITFAELEEDTFDLYDFITEPKDSVMKWSILHLNERTAKLKARKQGMDPKKAQLKLGASKNLDLANAGAVRSRGSVKRADPIIREQERLEKYDAKYGNAPASSLTDDRDTEAANQLVVRTAAAADVARLATWSIGSNGDNERNDAMQVAWYTAEHRAEAAAVHAFLVEAAVEEEEDTGRGVDRQASSRKWGGGEGASSRPSAVQSGSYRASPAVVVGGRANGGSRTSAPPPILINRRYQCSNCSFQARKMVDYTNHYDARCFYY
jgi:hypothetical protein